MEIKLKQRLVGAAVLVSLAVIFLPMLLDGEGKVGSIGTPFDIPARPAQPGSTLDLDAVTIAAPQPVPIPRPVAEPDDNPMDQAPPRSTPVLVVPEAAVEKRPALTSWVVQVGSFASEEKARGLRDRLRKLKYPAFLQLANAAGEPVYRVRIGPELDKARAEQLRDQLFGELRLQGIVLTHVQSTPP